MKKVIFLFLFVVLAITGQTQSLDAIVVNGIIHPTQFNEANYRTFSLDVCPLKFGYHESLLGLYIQNDEFYAKNEKEFWTSRMTQFHLGLSFNSTLGYNDAWFIKARLGIGWIKTHSDGDWGQYEDLQKDNFLQTSLHLAHWREDLSWLSRHQLFISYRQPFSAKKTAYWQGAEIESMTWNNQSLRAHFTESIFSAFLDREKDWKINIDLSVGIGMEHSLRNDVNATLVYPTIAGGVSFFKIPYHYQNLFELGFEQQFSPMNRWMITAKINLVPLLFWIWEKELINIGG